MDDSALGSVPGTEAGTLENVGREVQRKPVAVAKRFGLTRKRGRSEAEPKDHSFSYPGSLNPGKGEMMFGRNAARLCVLIAALFTLGTLSAVAAQAAEFHSEIEKTFSFGQQATENVVTTSAGTVKCKKATFEGVGIGTKKSEGNFAKQTALTHPNYSECAAFGQAATVSTTGCNFRSDQPTAELTATAAIVCEAGKSMEVKVTAAGCTVQFGAQEKLSKVKFTNQGVGAARDVLVTSEVSKVKYTSSGGVCGAAGTKEDGKYTGTVTMKGFSDAAHTKQIGVWVE